MKENRKMKRTAHGRKQASRPTIGMFTNWLGELHQVQWLGAVDAARAHQANLITFAGRELNHPDNFYAQANVIYDLVSPEQIDGLVLWTTTLQRYIGRQQLETFCQHYHPLPMVSVEQVIAGLPSVLMDDRQGMRAAVSHLIEVHGYRRIAFIRGSANHPGVQERYQGYVEALANHGLPLDPSLVSPFTHFRLSEEAAAIVHRLLDEHPPLTSPFKGGGKGGVEAIAAANDVLALGVLSALQARHINVPGEMAVVGFDNNVNIDLLDLGLYSTSDNATGAEVEPAVNLSTTTLPLTTVQPPFHGLGFRAVELLLAQIRGEPTPEVVTIPTELMVRRSCGCFSEAIHQRGPEPIVLRAQPPLGMPLPSARAAFTATLMAQREPIIAQMQQAIGPTPPALAPDWAERLLTAFISEVEGQFTNTFLAILDDLVRASVRSGDNLECWWRVLFTLRRQILPHLVMAEALARAEDLWQRAQMLIAEMIEQFYVYQQLQAEKRDQILREIGQKLITTFDLDQLAEILAEELPTLGIESCYLALYEPPHGNGDQAGLDMEKQSYPTAQSRAILVYDYQQRIELQADEAIFPSRQLAPGERLRGDRLYSMVVEPLYFRDQQLGFVLFEVGPQEGLVYEVLRGQLSSALQGALLVEREKRALTVVEEARARAEVANRAKSEFLANMSHELRTPLNTILGFGRLLARQSVLSREAQVDLDIILRSGEHLHSLINQILDLSKIEARRVTLNETNFDLYQLLEDLEDMFAFRAEDKNLQLIFERSPQVPRYIRADQVKLRQVLINLLNNALKFTTEGRVTLEIRMKDEGGGMKEERNNLDPSSLILPPSSIIPPSSFILYFSVADTGQGIAPEELIGLGGAFVQAQAGRQAQEGTGLGLAISHNFVQLMGGTLHLDSQFGQGTTVSFEIPVDVVVASEVAGLPDQAHRQVVALAPDQAQYRLLVVDDRWAARHLLVRLLAPLGFEVREASNGQEAIEIWTEWQPHLIWMDLRMPVLDGSEATRRIKATTQGQATTIVALTASSLEEERAEILAAGCDDFLRKPFHEADLFAVLHKHLGVHFVYQEASTPTAETALPEVDAAALAALPPKLLTALEQAVSQLDVKAIGRVIEAIQVHDAAVAQALAVLAKAYRYRRILQLIQAGLKEPDRRSKHE